MTDAELEKMAEHIWDHMDSFIDKDDWPSNYIKWIAQQLSTVRDQAIKECEACPWTLAVEKTKQKWLEEKESEHPCHKREAISCIGRQKYISQVISLPSEETIYQIVSGIWLDCFDRRGIKNAFENTDKDVQEDIWQTWSNIIRSQIRTTKPKYKSCSIEELPNKDQWIKTTHCPQCGFSAASIKQHNPSPISDEELDLICDYLQRGEMDKHKERFSGNVDTEYCEEVFDAGDLYDAAISGFRAAEKFHGIGEKKKMKIISQYHLKRTGDHKESQPQTLRLDYA